MRVHAFLNLDAKTIMMRRDVYMHFGAEEAAWKGSYYGITDRCMSGT